MENFSGVIFDLDGTLVESAPLYQEALATALRSNHVNVEPVNFCKLLSSMNLEQELIALNIRQDIAQRIAQHRDELVYTIFSERISWIVGADQCVETVKAKLPIALVTSTWATTVDAINTRIGIKNLFEIIIDGNSVHGKHKPDPYGLHLAAQLLYLPTARLIYVGDNETDVVAAHAANMKSCLIKRNTSKVVVTQPNYLVHSWQEFEEILERTK